MKKVDIDDSWDYKKEWYKLGWLRILDLQEGLEKYAGPGHWNDPDILEVGNGGMNYHEYVSHFSFWCLIAAPLMAGNDIPTINDSIKTILLNKDAIAVNQDKAGIQGRKVYDDGDFEIYAKPLQNGEIALIFFNRNDKRFDFPAYWEKAGVTKDMTVYDIWKHKKVGSTKQIKTVSIDGHSVLFYRLKKPNV